MTPVLKNKEKKGKTPISLFPFASLKYLLVILLSILVVLLLVDSWFLPGLEKSQKLNSVDWEADNTKINTNNKIKILQDPFRVWKSTLFPVFPEKKKSKRILVMGDSFVWGDGYANMNDIWWRQIQQELWRRGYWDVEVISSGFGGAWTRVQLMLAKKIVPLYNPDLIVWGFVSNDPDEKDQQGHSLVRQRDATCGDTKTYLQNLKRNDPFYAAFERFRVALPNIYPKLTERLLRLRLKKLMNLHPIDSEKYGYEYGEWEKKLYEGENFKQYKQTVKDLAAFMKQTQIPSFAISLPNKPDMDFKQKFDRARSVFEENGVAFFDILDDFVAGYENNKATIQWGINPANGHPGKTSTAFYAEKAVDIIEKNYSAILPKKETMRLVHPFYVNDAVPIEIVLGQQRNGVLLSFPPLTDALLQKRVLTMPYGEPYIQINFGWPPILRKINILAAEREGKTAFIAEAGGLRSAKVIVCYDNREEIDERVLSEKTGNQLTWDLEESKKRVSALKIMARFESPEEKDRLISVQFE